MPEFGDVTLGQCGANVGPDSTMEDIANALEFACAVQRHSPWWIGDLILELDRRYGDKGAQCLPLGYSLGLIERCKGISRNVPYAVRNPHLSWTHHIEAGRLPPEAQKTALDQCERDNWTAKDFQVWVTNTLKSPMAVRRLCE